MYASSTLRAGSIKHVFPTLLLPTTTHLTFVVMTHIFTAPTGPGHVPLSNEKTLLLLRTNRACSGLGGGGARLEMMAPCRKNQAGDRAEVPIRWE